MPSLTDGEVVQNFQSRALKLTRELECVRRDNAERERELSAAEKVVILLFVAYLRLLPLGSLLGACPPRAVAGRDRSSHSRV
jgi:hypothetical protein